MCDLLEYFTIDNTNQYDCLTGSLYINDMYQGYTEWGKDYIECRYNGNDHGLSVISKDIFYNIRNNLHGLAMFDKKEIIFYINDEPYGIQAPI